MILFCLPYAGGSKNVYFPWKKCLDSSIRLVPIELKGRGSRFNEDFYESLDEAVNDIFDIIKDNLMYEDYAIFGHSMGSLLAYELYYKITKENYKAPKHIFFSGHQAPEIISNSKIHSLPDEVFISEIMKMGGTPKEVLENKPLLDLFLPVLRNDFKIIENYQYIEKSKKIQCGISVLNGNDDIIPANGLLSWKNHSINDFELINFNGGHFFIKDDFNNVLNYVNKTLLTY